MFKHILVPLDGSTLAECVLAHVIPFAKVFDARITLFHIQEQPAGSLQTPDLLDWSLRKAEAETYLNDVTDRLRGAGIETDSIAQEGKPADRIVEYIHDHDIDLVAFCSHGQGGPSPWNIGSVAKKVILRSGVSTLITRAFSSPEKNWTGISYRKLLVPLDGSQRAECALPVAISLARYYDASLQLAHAVSQPEMPRRAPLTTDEADLVKKITERNREEASRYLRQLRCRLSLKAETRLVVNHNGIRALHQLVEDEAVDLVAMSAHGYSGETRWPYGSVTMSFIEYSTKPLLIIQDVPLTEREPTAAEVAVRERKGH